MSDGGVSAWWKQVLQAPVADPGDWDRQPERDALYADYAAFCKRARTKPVAPDAFVRRLRPLMPERGFAARLRTAPDSGNSGGYGRRDVPVRFEHLCIPALGECRRAFDAAAGTGPLDWQECRGGGGDPGWDVSAVEDWWRWKLESGVTVPDEADPYCRDDVYWNRAPAADLLFASYRGFCEDEGREPVRPGFFVELFDALLPTDVCSDRRILFRGIVGNAEGCVDVGRLERVLCYRLPSLADCREAFAANTGRMETWPAAADAPSRSTPVTRAPDREAVRLWWRWKLALGCLIPDDRIGPQMPGDGPTYEWESSAYASALHTDCAEFCRRHGRKPVEFGAFVSEFASLAPAGMPEDPDHDEIEIPPLEECRAWFEGHIAGGPVAWPTRADSGD